MSKQNKKSYISQEGFTLVELLIVIVIIGILAGVVIGILNPVQQQNRAKDAAARAQLDKMALSTKSLLVSSPRSTNRTPTTAEFAAGIGNTPDAAANCNSNVTAGAANCKFTLNGLSLPANCGASGYVGAVGGSTQCSYFFYRNSSASAEEFKIAAHGGAKPAATFVYYYYEDASTGIVTEGFYSCADTYDSNVSGAPAGCTLLN